MGARPVLARLMVALGVLAVGAGAMLAVQALVFGSGFTWPIIAALALLAAAVAAVWAGFIVIDHHFDALESLRGALLVAAGREAPLIDGWPKLGDSSVEALKLGAAAARAIAAHRALGGNTDDKLAAVVGAVADGLLVITDSGLVSLVNEAARAALGEDAVAVGTSVYAALDRDEMAALERRVRDAGAALAVTLPHVDGRGVEAVMAPLDRVAIDRPHDRSRESDPDIEDRAGEPARRAHGGFVISLPHSQPGTVGKVQHDLTLHDRPPAVRLDPAAADDWPLEDLPVLVLDSETTGLDVAAARIVSLGAVRGHGWRLYPHANLDCLVNPGVPIPRLATSVHGISDAMAAEAPGFAETLPALSAILDGTVMVGHSIGFDLAILGHECERRGLPWRAPPALDTSLLFAGLYPTETDANLEPLAERFGVEIRGRHTALGDALVTAEIWLALLPRLIDGGVRTYGEARRLSARPTGLLAQHRRAGWVIAAGADETESADG